MALFAIQLTRLVLTSIVMETNEPTYYAGNLIMTIHQQLNVIITSVIPMFYFTDDLARLGNNTYNHPCAGLIGIVFPRREFARRSCRKFVLCV